MRIFYGDGQSVIRFKDLKRAFTSRYASWLIGVGGFHEHAHAMFAYTEMFKQAPDGCERAQHRSDRQLRLGVRAMADAMLGCVLIAGSPRAPGHKIR